MLFLLYLLFPIVEIYLLIQAGEEFGFWPIFGVVVLTAWLGSRLVKYEGFQVLKELQAKAAQGQDPHFELLQGVVLLLGGVLLIAPGFITDVMGILCLIPYTRRWIARAVRNSVMKNISRGRVHVFTNFGGAPPGRRPGPSTWQDNAQSGERDVSPKKVIDVSSERVED